MINLDEEEAYSFQSEEGRFKVVDWEENVILVCSDRASAEQYAELMNRAFRRGFKMGVLKGRKT